MGRRWRCPNAGSARLSSTASTSTRSRTPTATAIGDLAGLIDRLDYLARLGVTCIWLNPIHPSPDRDDGYDITDFYAVHPRLGTLGDFVELDPPGRQPRHPGDDRPRRQPHLRRAPVVPGRPVPTPTSPYRDWYVWSADRAVRPPPGDGVPRLPGHDVDVRRAGRGLVLPPLLRLPARPQHGQPAGPPGDREDHRLLAAARRRRVPARRRAVHHRADRRPATRARARTSRGSTTSGRSCRGAAATP